MNALKVLLSFFFLMYIPQILCINVLSERNLYSIVCNVDSLNILLNRLDLTINDLKKLKVVKETDRQKTELLKYFKSREHIKHPIDRNVKHASFGKIASEEDFQVANDALKHIFVGQSAYPRFLCGNDINWDSRPVPDNEWVWQLNRMSFWNSMARVYWHTSDEKYVKAWGYQLMDWVRKNPNDDGHKYAWRSIEVGIRGNIINAIINCV